METQPPFALFELPPEIRNRIYELALVGSNEELIIKDAPSPALLRTSRQIRQEASSIYYGCNIFLIANAEALCIPWLMSRPAIMRSHIKTIRVYTNCSMNGVDAFNYKTRLISRLCLGIKRRGFKFEPEMQVFFRLDSKLRPVWVTTPRK